MLYIYIELPFPLGEQEAKVLLSLSYLLKWLIDLSVGGWMGFRPREAHRKYHREHKHQQRRVLNSVLSPSLLLFLSLPISSLSFSLPFFPTLPPCLSLSPSLSLSLFLIKTNNSKSVLFILRDELKILIKDSKNKPTRMRRWGTVHVVDKAIESCPKNAQHSTQPWNLFKSAGRPPLRCSNNKRSSSLIGRQLSSRSASINPYRLDISHRCPIGSGLLLGAKKKQLIKTRWTLWNGKQGQVWIRSVVTRTEPQSWIMVVCQCMWTRIKATGSGLHQ